MTETTTDTPAPQAPAPDDAAAPVADAGADDTTILGGAAAEAPVGEAAPDAAPPEDAPAVPEAYELAAPEGMTLDAESVAEAEPVFRELGLSNEAANKLIPVAAAFAKRVEAKVSGALQAQIVQTRKAWADEALADAELGGSPENHSLVKATAAKALDRFAGPEFRQFLDETGLGNHPAMLRMAWKVGQAISEDSDFVRSDAAPAPKLTDAEKFYGKKG